MWWSSQVEESERRCVGAGHVLTCLSRVGASRGLPMKIFVHYAEPALAATLLIKSFQLRNLHSRLLRVEVNNPLLLITMLAINEAKRAPRDPSGISSLIKFQTATITPPLSARHPALAVPISYLCHLGTSQHPLACTPELKKQDHAMI